jgi:hypothetical protein
MRKQHDDWGKLHKVRFSQGRLQSMADSALQLYKHTCIDVMLQRLLAIR